VGETKSSKARRQSACKKAQDERRGQSQTLGISEGSMGQSQSSRKEIAVISLSSNQECSSAFGGTAFFV
jgi:hypothetical protein